MRGTRPRISLPESPAYYSARLVIGKPRYHKRAEKHSPGADCLHIGKHQPQEKRREELLRGGIVSFRSGMPERDEADLVRLCRTALRLVRIIPGWHNKKTAAMGRRRFCGRVPAHFSAGEESSLARLSSTNAFMLAMIMSKKRSTIFSSSSLPRMAMVMVMSPSREVRASCI